MDKAQTEQLEQEAAFAAMGQQVINNEAYRSAITTRKAQIFEIFCNTSQDQHDVREEAWRTMKNMDALESFFDQLLTTGKMAEETLKSNTDE